MSDDPSKIGGWAALAAAVNRTIARLEQIRHTHSPCYVEPVVTAAKPPPLYRIRRKPHGPLPWRVYRWGPFITNGPGAYAAIADHRTFAEALSDVTTRTAGSRP